MDLGLAKEGEKGKERRHDKKERKRSYFVLIKEKEKRSRKLVKRKGNKRGKYKHKGEAKSFEKNNRKKGNGSWHMREREIWRLNEERRTK